jgi:hypothetical protein
MMKRNGSLAVAPELKKRVGGMIFMRKLSEFPVRRTSRKRLIIFLATGALLVNVEILTVKFNITGSHEGIFLLKGEPGALLEVKDDLYFGEASRYLAGIDFDHARRIAYTLFNRYHGVREPYLYYRWDDKNGEGFVRTYLPGGKRILVNFSRFVDEFGKEASGLFVGGGLPADVSDDDKVKLNATGMGYYDGARWFHIWCNANEAIFSRNLEPRYPSSWKYLGSRVIHHSEDDLLLESKHEVLIDNVPLRIDRHAHFRAGAAYFILTIAITNTGTNPVSYYYLYGDDPWLGNYGTSGGNVGWSGDGFYYFVGRLNTGKYRYAGYFDYGNGAIGERHSYTRLANFIEWFGDTKPFVYFSNGPFDIPPLTNEKIPLSSNARFIGINWEQTLRPEQSVTYTLAIGMADIDPKTGLPVKPRVDLKNFP